MSEVQMLPIIATGLPESTVSCWFIREGEPLTPGPLLALHTRSFDYLLSIPGSATRLLGVHLQHILLDEGARITADCPLALLQPGWALTEQDGPMRSEHRDIGVDQQPLAPIGLELDIQCCSSIHIELARRSARYRRLFRRYYPLFMLARPMLALCLVLVGWGLIRGLEYSASALLGEDLPAQPLFSLLSTIASWAVLVSLCCFALLFLLRCIEVLTLRRRRSLLHSREERVGMK